jgi:hypothetical protein
VKRSEVGAALAALRRKVAHKCLQCGKAFRGLATARYCGNACRQRAKYARSKQSSGS